MLALRASRLTMDDQRQIEQGIEGMTVNERLFHFGLVDHFDAAAKARDVSAMVRVLLQARFSEEQAQFTATTVAADPSYYGH